MIQYDHVRSVELCAEQLLFIETLKNATELLVIFLQTSVY